MEQFATNYNFEDVLKGEFAGKIYILDKFLPVADTLRQDASLKDFFSSLENSPNQLIYFNSQTKTVFAINYSEDKHQMDRGRLKVEIIKPAAQDISEIHKFSYRLAQIFPASLLTIVDEYHHAPELELA